MTSFDQKKAVLVAIISQQMHLHGYQLVRKNTLQPTEMQMYLLRKQKLSTRLKEKLGRKSSS